MRPALLTMMLLLGACGAGSPIGGEQTCSLLGCVDELTATVHASNGGLPEGRQALTVTADGATVTCSFTLPLAMLPSGATVGIVCPAGLQVFVGPPSNCATSNDGQSTSLTCTPIAGKLDEHVTIMGKPSTVHVTQTVNGALALDETVTPAYAATRPNGPSCEPLCAQADVTWVLTAP